jgi:hypothetical protein
VQLDNEESQRSRMSTNNDTFEDKLIDSIINSSNSTTSSIDREADDNDPPVTPTKQHRYKPYTPPPSQVLTFNLTLTKMLEKKEGRNY